MIKLKEKKIRQMIAETGHTVTSWGEKYGFPQTTLSNWLTGARNIKRSSLEKLAEALGCEPQVISDFIFEYTGAGIAELEADREEICGIFGNLSKEQRKSIINMAQLIANANKTIEQ
jgi:transcriptional regulator with XRE-family HTH domain